MNDTPNLPQDAASPDASRPRSAAEASGVDPRLLEILVCPLTKTTLRYDRERNELVSLAAHLAFPIRDGIPIMLPEEARPIDE
jgi:uncharacterized protein